MTHLEMWSAFLGYAADPTHRHIINEVLKRKDAIGMAGAVLAAISKDEHERAKFLSRRKFETDMTSNLLTVEERGRREGIREIARKLKDSGTVSVEQISALSGLSVSEIERL